MNERELLTLIQKGEGHTIEFKETLNKYTIGILRKFSAINALCFLEILPSIPAKTRLFMTKIFSQSALGDLISASLKNPERISRKMFMKAFAHFPIEMADIFC